MTRKTVRSYYSLVRQQQADETRARIAGAARALILERGYEEATIEAIAAAAGVATPTVYAVFGSKRRLLKELVDRAAFGPAYQDLLAQVAPRREPLARLRFAPRIARQIYESEWAELALLRQAGVVLPELAAIEREQESSRYEAQGPTVALLVQGGCLPHGMTEGEARDILWTLTGRDVYRLLVGERGWTPDRYQAWLGDALVAALIAPRA